MSGSIFIIFVSGMILLTIVSVLKIDHNRKRRKDQELIRLKKSTTDLTLGFVWTALFILWTGMFVNHAQKVYQLLSQEYMDSFFQLFDIEFLSHMSLYFIENFMFEELNTIAYYENNFFSMLSWIIGTLCLSIIFIKRGMQKNTIYENGILVDNKFINWKNVNKYQWSNVYEKRYFKNEKYYELMVTLSRSKPWNLNNKVKVEVDYDDKEIVEDIIKNYK